MKWKLLIGGVVLLAAGAAAYTQFGPGPVIAKRQEAAAARQEVVLPPAVTVVKVKTSDFVETVAVSGSLIARDEILVSPEIDGYRVLELLADEGDKVKAGQVLAQLVTDQIDAQLAQNDASQARGDAAIAQARSLISEVEAKLVEAKASLERARPLKQSGYLSESTFDQRQSVARSLEAQLVSARDGLKVAQADKSKIDAERREIEWRRGNTDVRAPTDGVISRRSARIGAMAVPSADPMFRIIARGEIELDAEVVELEIAKLREGQKAKIIVPGAGDVTGTVRLIAREVDKSTRIGRVKVFIGANDKLRVGAFARGVIETEKSRGLAIPSSAVMFDPDGTHVQVVNSDSVSRKTVTTGLQADGMVEILSGLNDGDLVVARSGTFLRDGDKIRPITPDQAVSEAR